MFQFLNENKYECIVKKWKLIPNHVHKYFQFKKKFNVIFDSGIRVDVI